MVSASILENIGDAIYGVGPDWRVRFFNRQAERFFGRGREEVVGRGLLDCFPAAKGTQVDAAIRAVMTGREPLQMEMLSPSTGRWADVRVFPVDDGGVAVSFRDITETKKLEAALRDAIQNQDMLFRELTHRVTNNFQEVASRLSLQGRDVQDPTARDMCEKMASSIRCMALVHRRLYRSSNRVDDQDLGDYVRALCEDLASTLPPNISIEARVDGGAVVPTEVATTVGMMVAELVMNSRKYAWAPGARGRIVVALRRDGELIEVQLWDDGRGVPEGTDLTRSEGFGLKLLQAQVKRLHGSFSQRNVEGGATFTLRFPAPQRTGGREGHAQAAARS